MKKMVPAVIALCAVVCTVIIIIQNTGFKTVEYTVSCPDLPEQFDGFRISLVADLHNRRHESLAAKAAEYSPDIIVIGGDLVGRDDRNITPAVETVRELCDVAPVYYTSGNHEAESDMYGELCEALLREGVHILENDGEEIACGDSVIRICGATDPSFYIKDERSAEENVTADTVRKNVAEAMGGYEGFTLLIAHRPEYFNIYGEAGADVILSGHAHGGAVCLPFNKAIWAPGQGFFPEYTGGVYYSGKSAMALSRGLGDSTVPFRVNCPYELVICTLKAE